MQKHTLVCSPAGQASAVAEVAQPTEQAESDPPGRPAVPVTPSDSLAWLPATSAAISLRLFAIDAAIIYRPGNLPGRELIPVSAVLCIACYATRHNCIHCNLFACGHNLDRGCTFFHWQMGTNLTPYQTYMATKKRILKSWL